MISSTKPIVFRALAGTVKLDKCEGASSLGLQLFSDHINDKLHVVVYDLYVFKERLFLIPVSASVGLNWGNIGIVAGGGLAGIVSGAIAGLTHAAANVAKDKASSWQPLSYDELQAATENGDAVCINFKKCEIVVKEFRTSWDIFGGTWATNVEVSGTIGYAGEETEAKTYLNLGDAKAKTFLLPKTLKDLGVRFSIVRG